MPQRDRVRRPTHNPIRRPYIPGSRTSENPVTEKPNPAPVSVDPERSGHAKIFKIQRAVNRVSSRPNILLLMCDQLSAGVLECYGGQARSPNISRIASDGAMFTNAICPYPICSPSRASMITGKAPHSHGITHNVNRLDYPSIPSPSTEEGLKADDLTTGRILSSEGYETHHYGKWHLSDGRLPYYEDMYRENQEYLSEIAEVFRRARKLPDERWLSWYSWDLPVTVDPEVRDTFRSWGDRWMDDPLGRFIRHMGRLDLPVEDTFDYRAAERCVQAVERAEEPFMITCSFNYPHSPEVIPSPYYESYTREEIRLPGNFDALEERFKGDISRRIYDELGEIIVREFLRFYYGSILLVDDMIGRILDSLEEAGKLDDTIIVFTADHGDMVGGHGMISKGTKALYDEMIRIPLLIRSGEEPRTVERDVSLMDLMPTLLELAGSKRRPDGWGRSLVPYLTGSDGPPIHRYCFCENLTPNQGHTRQLSPETRGIFVIRGKGWKYLRYMDGEEYLYHLTDDPGETRDLSDDPEAAEMRKKLSRELDNWLEETGYPGVR